jgi:hypothetical protein
MSNWVQKNIAGLFLHFGVVPQPMVEKIPLPMNSLMDSQEMLPVLNRQLHPWLPWKGNDPMEMIRHQEKQATVPSQVLVIEGCRRKD